ncbi:MAG: 3-isopropylmalate dehydratase small subunit, partial [Paramuribaculum sp.]|nr:3-isopropylmalate dehydratase small subunit [Paramuribaculum sp.]
VVSSFFADIHRNNELNNFVLPVTVTEDFLAELTSHIEADPNAEVTIDLERQTITDLTSGRSEQFEINSYKKECLINGLDDIDYLLSHRDDIEKFEKANNK